MPAPRILLVEDDHLDAEVAEALLREGLPRCAVRHVETIGGAVDAMGAGHYGCVLLDMRLPDGSGADALRRVRAAAGDTPVVVLTSVADDILAEQLVANGAEDYLVKGRLGPESLARVVRYATHRRARARGEDAPEATTDGPAVALLGHHELLLEGLAAALRAAGRFRLLGTFADPAALRVATVATPPDVTLVELTTPDPGAPFVVQTLRDEIAAGRVVLFADATEEHLDAVLDDHADGLLLTTSGAEQIVGALDQVLADQLVLPGGWRAMRRRAQEPPDPVATLSDRQREVLELVAAGHSNEQIAQRLIISINTVKFHVRSAYSALGIRNRVQAAQLLAAQQRTTPDV